MATQRKKCEKCGDEAKSDHHTTKYCSKCCFEIRNARAVAANRKKYAATKAAKPKKFCGCGADITHLRHNAIKCRPCSLSNKTERKKHRYRELHGYKAPETTCKVCGEPKVEGRLLCHKCQNEERSERYYERQKSITRKEKKPVDYSKFKDYPSNTKEYHRYTAQESLKRRNEKVKPCVYMMQCGGLIYIGQTKRSIDLRIRSHKHAAWKHGSRIYQAIRSGYEVTYDVLEMVTADELRLTENYYIAAYKDLYGDRVVNQKLNRRSQYV